VGGKGLVQKWKELLYLSITRVTPKIGKSIGKSNRGEGGCGLKLTKVEPKTPKARWGKFYREAGSAG